eukprot:TRINITY_DN24533_c0_g2_i10.p1 TRINITY_DN24533_c0_g2~~TRINITY_DN24533_c0_g2_i10.p1  ORF type:complete len:324 (+),score=103.07 TRINITY_DN24533_c0_g2_i10:81-1052(+)
MAVYFYDKNGYWRCEGRRRYEWRQSDRQVREPGQANEDGDWWRLFYVNKLEEKIKMLEEKVDKMNKQLMEKSDEDSSWRWWLEWRMQNMQNTEYHYYSKLGEVRGRVGGDFEGMLMKEGGDFELDGVSVEDFEAIKKNVPMKIAKKSELDNYGKMGEMMELLNKTTQKDDVEKLLNMTEQKHEPTRRCGFGGDFEGMMMKEGGDFKEETEKTRDMTTVWFAGKAMGAGRGRRRRCADGVLSSCLAVEECSVEPCGIDGVNPNIPTDMKEAYQQFDNRDEDDAKLDDTCGDEMMCDATEAMLKKMQEMSESLNHMNKRMQDNFM